MQTPQNIPSRLKPWHKVSTIHGKATIVKSWASNSMVKLLLENGQLLEKEAYIRNLSHIKTSRVRNRIDIDWFGRWMLTIEKNHNGDVAFMKLAITKYGDPLTLTSTSDHDFCWKLVQHICEKNHESEKENLWHNQWWYASQSYLNDIWKRHENMTILDPYTIIPELFSLDEISAIWEKVPKWFNIEKHDSTTMKYYDDMKNKEHVTSMIFDILCAQRWKKIFADAKKYNQELSKSIASIDAEAQISLYDRHTWEAAKTILRINILSNAIKEMKRIDKMKHVSLDTIQEIEKWLQTIESLIPRIDTTRLQFSIFKDQLDEAKICIDEYKKFQTQTPIE